MCWSVYYDQPQKAPFIILSTCTFICVNINVALVDFCFLITDESNISAMDLPDRNTPICATSYDAWYVYFPLD